MTAGVGERETSEFQERRLSRAVEHVSKHWLPYNPLVLQSIRTGVTEGRYELGTDFLLSDLKQDLGLFSFCLRELVHARKRHDSTLQLESPEDCFRNVTSSEIIDLLNRAEVALSSHSLANAKNSQAAHLRFTLISAATAEVLASKTELDSEAAFLSAMFRQLGLLLVAWNYPTVYERVQRAVGVGPALDMALNEQLGFSPEMLGQSILQRFSPAPDLDAAVKVGMQSEQAEGALLSQSAAQLAEICRIGEVLAQANDPEHYPIAGSTWNEAKQAITQSLGADGLRIIREAVVRYGSSYRSAFPDLLGALDDIDPDAHQQRVSRQVTLQDNPFVDHCPLHIRQRLVSFYESLAQSQDPRSAVARILKEVIPVTGFEGGVIATVDPMQLELVPRLKFGQVVLRQVAKMRYGSQYTTEDPLLAALLIPAPYISRAQDARYAFAVGGIGGDQPLGVFYAEYSAELLDRKDFDLLVVFKAVLRAFEDALGVGKFGSSSI